MSSQLQRLPDWPERLVAYIEERRGQAFAWGVNDCATFAAGAVRALTGADPLGELRGSWRTEAEAGQLLHQEGGLLEAALARLGRPVRTPAQAGRGAVVLAVIPDGPTLLGVLLGAFWCAPGAAGLEFRPAGEVRLAWEV